MIILDRKVKNAHMNSEKIGKFIKSIRQKEGISQQKFANKYGVTYQAVSKWETGKNIPDIAILKQICRDYNMNLDDFLDAKISRLPKPKIYITLIILLIIIILCTFLIITSSSNFQFKTLAAGCDNFNLSGSIAYDKNKSSIYISNISYCGKKNQNQYQKIDCVLYEQINNKKIKISEYNYSEKSLITLDDFLKEVQFNVDNYSQTCKLYKENSLFLEIQALTINNTLTTYQIPLRLQDNCLSNSTQNRD